MNNYKKALEIIHDFLKERNLEDNWDELKNDIHYYLDYTANSIEDEERVPLGKSKIWGLPHLPDHIELLPEEFFVAQLNCAEIKPYDILNLLPEKGILYFFMADPGDARCAYFNGSVDLLKVRQYSEPENLPYQPQELMEWSETMDFEDNDFIVLRKFFYEDILGEKFEELVTKLKEELGEKIKIQDSFDQAGLPFSFVFGEPLFWQDETFYDDNPSYKPLFCFEYAEGNINFFLKGGALDISKDIDNQIIGIYSGT